VSEQLAKVVREADRPGLEPATDLSGAGLTPQPLRHHATLRAFKSTNFFSRLIGMYGLVSIMAK